MSQADAPGIANQAARFASTGAAGFCVDLAATLLMAPVLGPDFGRIAAIILAVSVTFQLNRRWTFRGRDRAIVRQAMRYAIVSAAGAGVNFVVFHGFLVVLAAAKFVVTSSAGLAMAVAVGSIGAMGFNFCGAKFFAFAR